MRITRLMIPALIGFIGSQAQAGILSSPNSASSGGFLEQVKVVCHENGYCVRPPTRRPVAKWVYGDNNFRGPYVGPAYYGAPPYRYRWWPFYWW